jgi:hypothetical protein
MAACPQCNKPLVELTRQCPSCRADLDLLVDYVNGLRCNLQKAEQLTRAGELGQAMWAYLQVLEVDPDNPAASRQVGQVATAVRQFDRTAPGRRWAQGLPLHSTNDDAGTAKGLWAKGLLILTLVVLAFGLGLLCGQSLTSDGEKPEAPKKEELRKGPDNQLGPPGGP